MKINKKTLSVTAFLSLMTVGLILHTQPVQASGSSCLSCRRKPPPPSESTLTKKLSDDSIKTNETKALWSKDSKEATDSEPKPVELNSLDIRRKDLEARKK